MLIAGLVIFSHSLIPHDHHYTLANDLAKEHQHDENNEPLHCHFLDYVTADATIQKTISRKIVQQPILFAILFSISFEEELNPQTHSIISDKKPDLLTFIASSPTRGSPLFS